MASLITSYRRYKKSHTQTYLKKVKKENGWYHERRPRFASLLASTLGPQEVVAFLLEVSPHPLLGTCFALGEISLCASKPTTFLPLTKLKSSLVQEYYDVNSHVNFPYLGNETFEIIKEKLLVKKGIKISLFMVDLLIIYNTNNSH